MKTDEFGRIVLADRVRDTLHNVEQSLTKGTSLTEEMFQLCEMVLKLSM